MKMRSFLKLLRSRKRELYEDAIRLYNGHEYGQAIEKFEKIVMESPSSKGLHYRLSHFYLGQARLKLGILLYALGNFSKAAYELEKAAEFNPDHIGIFEYLGICYNNTGRFEKAIGAFEYFLERKPDHVQTRLRLEIVYHNVKMWDKAISICNQILKEVPNYADVHFHLGLAYLGKGEPRQALLSFENALKINPYYRDARIRLGITLAYLGELDKALSEILPLVDAFPGFADFRYFLGIVYAARNEMPKAIDSFEHALQINPSFRDARAKLGMLLCRAGRYGDALAELEAAQALDPNNSALGLVVERLRRFLTLGQEDRRGVPSIIEGIIGKEGIVAQAIQEFNRHLEIAPSFTEMLSVIKYFPDEDLYLFESLIPVINKYIDQNPHHAHLYNALGPLCVKAKRYDAGEEAFRKALNINPKYREARFNLFNILKEQEKLDIARKEGETLLEQGLSYPDFYCSLSEIYLALGMFDRAEAVLNLANDIRPAYAKTHFILSKVCESQGRKETAIEELKRCMDCDPPESLRQEGMERLKQLTSHDMD